MTGSDVDTERTAVRTYVPAYQREEWDEHAEDLDMSRSEFVRTMVQAGRRSFGAGNGPAGVDPSDGTEPDPGSGSGSNSDSNADGSGGSPADLESRVLAALESGEFLTWEELLGELTDGIEDRLEATLEDLQAKNRVRHSGRNGGYTLEDEQ